MSFDKPTLRAAIHARLRQSTPDERNVWSVKIRRHLVNSADWLNARTVMLFAALRYEPDLLPLMSLAHGKRLVFPALEHDQIIPREVTGHDDFVHSPSGIREPAAERCPVVPASEIDLVLVPGLAFSRDGTRLGRGKGYYDRFLASLPGDTVLCGVCFGCQVIDSIPSEPHDVPVPVLVSEEGRFP